MTVDERLGALTMNLEMMGRDIEGLRVTSAQLVKAARQDGENIRALARMTEIHERRLTDLEGGGQP